jgi:hypothetical protein
MEYCKADELTPTLNTSKERDMIIAILVLFLVIAAIGIKNDHEITVLGIFGVLAILGVCLGSYMFHARDVGVIAEQDRVVKVYEENIKILNDSLSNLQPKGVALVNQDTPVASLVDAITDSTLKLAAAKQEKAEAYVSIAQRKASPFWFVVSLTTDVK